MADITDQGTLTEPVYYILLALHRPMHGYGIMQFVREISKDRVNLGPGTLYGAISTLLEKGWIRAVPGAADSRKKDYEITPAGHRAVEEELLRLRELMENGREIAGGER